MKKIVIAIILIFILILSILGYKVMVTDNEEAELVEISSKAELEAIYNRDIDEISIPSKLLTLPFSILYESSRSFTSSMGDVVINSSGITPDSYTGSSGITPDTLYRKCRNRLYNKYTIYKGIFYNQYTSRKCR